MSDLSFWDILFLKDEIGLEEYVFIEWVVPLTILAVILAAAGIYEYGSDFKYWLKKKFRKK